MNLVSRSFPLEADNVFDTIFGVLSHAADANRADVLKVDVIEKENQFLIYADVPGVARENIKVNFDKGNLKIEVEARTTKEQLEGEKVIRNERYFSRKVRSFYLGDKIDEDAIKATYQEGVLVLDLPKKQSVLKVKEIEIQ